MQAYPHDPTDDGEPPEYDTVHDDGTLMQVDAAILEDVDATDDELLMYEDADVDRSPIAEVAALTKFDGFLDEDHQSDQGSDNENAISLRMSVLQIV